MLKSIQAFWRISEIIYYYTLTIKGTFSEEGTTDFQDMRLTMKSSSPKKITWIAGIIVQTLSGIYLEYTCSSSIFITVSWHETYTTRWLHCLFSRKKNWDLLRTIYQHPHHIDLFVGGLAEDAMKGAIVGPLFGKIIALQFKYMKDGDR